MFGGSMFGGSLSQRELANFPRRCAGRQASRPPPLATSATSGRKAVGSGIRAVRGRYVVTFNSLTTGSEPPVASANFQGRLAFSKAVLQAQTPTELRGGP